METIKDLITEYLEQNNRSTAYPVFYTIRDVKYEPSYYIDDGDRFVLIWDTEPLYTAGTTEELFKQIIADKDEYGFKIPDDLDLENIYQHDCEQFDQINDYSHGIYSEREVWEKKGMFLFEKEAEQHLKTNAHHYSKKAHTYANHSWRAPKTERLFKLLAEQYGLSDKWK